ncbi:hypothetical protein JCM10207_007044 [Rhodosporidiobolus poonsookiae]
MDRPASDRGSYSQLPTSTSSSSLHTINLASPPSHAPPQQSGFFFSSLSTVWSGLKAAAGLEVEGFFRGIGGSEARTGEKRERAHEDSALGSDAHAGTGGGRKRRRKTEPQPVAQDDFLFDGVPPLMPPISHASPLPPQSAYSYRSSSHFSSSPVASRSHALSSSPETSRRDLRPYARPSYEDSLMTATATGEDILPPLPSFSRNSTEQASGLRSLSGRRKVSVSGEPSAAPSATTSALAGRGGHSRAQSYAAAAVPLPNPRHVHFAPIPSSTSLPNLASIANKSPKTPRKSPSSAVPTVSASASKAQVAEMLFGDALGGDVSRVWAAAKDEERRSKEEEQRAMEEADRQKRERREKRIRELEDEVQRLKGELSTTKQPPAHSPFSKSPRRSAPPPPPPAPPPPPVGKPHPLLLSIRQSLKATPPRPSSSTASKQKRRLSTLGGEGSTLDMGAFFEELGGKRGKLRKVGLPEERRKERERERREKSGELGDVLHRAFQRKFAGVPASPSTPHLPTSRSTFNLGARNPEWTSPRPTATSTGISHSRSHPAGLSSFTKDGSIPPVPPLPPQPVFTSTSTPSASASTSAAPLPPRSSSLASTETTVFGRALTTDAPASSGPAPLPSPALGPASFTSTSISPSTSIDSLAGMTSAPPEAFFAPSSASASFPSIPASTPAKPDAAATPDADAGADASDRLSRARRRSGDGSPLPGLELGRARPVTPGRQKARRASGSASGSATKRIHNAEGAQEEQEEEEEEEQIVLVSPIRRTTRSPKLDKGKGKARAAPTSSPVSGSAKKRRSASTLARDDKAAERAAAYALFEQEVLRGTGDKRPDAGRVFGRA